MNASVNLDSHQQVSVVAILDIDGTLLDSSAIHAKAADSAFAALDIEIDGRPLEAYRNFTDWGVLDELMLEKSGSGATRAQFEQFEKVLADAFVDYVGKLGLEEIKGAKRFVSELLSGNTVLPVFATGSCRSAAELKLRTIGVDPDNVILKTGSEHISREEIYSCSPLCCNRPPGPRQHFHHIDR